MGYEAGAIIGKSDHSALDAVASYHKRKGDDFSAKSVYEDGVAFYVCGYEFSRLTSELRGRAVAHVDDGDDWEYDLVPIGEFIGIANSIRAFLKTPGGESIGQADANDLPWEIGDWDDDECTVIPADDAHDAFEALDSTGYGDALAHLLDHGRLTCLLELGEIAELAVEEGAEQLGWYESY